MLKISVGPALIFGLLIYLMMRGIPTASTETESLRDYFTSLFKLLRRRGMQALVATTALRSMGQGAMMAFLPVYLLEDQGISAIVIGLFLSSIQFVGILAQPAMGWLADKFGHKRVLVPGTAALGLLMIALKFAPTDDPLMIDIVLLNITLPGIQFGIIALAMGAFLYALHAIYIAAAMDVSQGRGSVNGCVADIRRILPWCVLAIPRGRHRGRRNHIGRLRVRRGDGIPGGCGIGFDSTDAG